MAQTLAVDDEEVSDGRCPRDSALPRENKRAAHLARWKGRAVSCGELPRGDETILVVEDDEGIRRLTVEIISKHGYKVFEAHPGTPVPSAPYSPSFITTEGKHPRDSRGHDRKLPFEGLH